MLKACPALRCNPFTSPMNSFKTPTQSRLKILVIDDELGPRESLKYLLGDEFDVDTSDRVEGGLSKIRETTYDTIIMDIRLPAMNGIEGLAKIREIDMDVSIIMLTGYGNLETAQEAIRLGASEYVTKPFDVHKMLEVVKRHTSKTGLRRQKALMLKEVNKMNDILKGQLEERESMASWGKASARLVHDLSSPLTAILGYSSLLLHEVRVASDGDETSLENALAYAETLERNANFCRDLAKSWKDVCKGKENGEVFDIGKIAQKLKTDVFFNSENIEILSEANLTIRGSDVEITRLFNNLIRNGLEAKSNENEAVRVLVNIGTERKNVLVSVSDNGCGMSEEILKRMQAGNFTTKGENGTGLGFIICKRIVEAHEGSISISSKEGEGTKITFTLKAWTQS